MRTKAQLSDFGREVMAAAVEQDRTATVSSVIAALWAYGDAVGIDRFVVAAQAVEVIRQAEEEESRVGTRP